MTRFRRGFPRAVATRVARAGGAAGLSIAMLLCTPGLSSAVPSQDADSVAALIADVAEANQRLQDLGAEIRAEKEAVNQAIVELGEARDHADDAQRTVELSQQAVKDADAEIIAARRRLNTFAAATYVHGPSDSYLTARNPGDMIATAAAGEALTASAEQVMVNLHRARVEQVNKESQARAVRKTADQAVAQAQSSQDTAVAALTDTQRKFVEQQGQIDELVARRNEAQARLDAARRADERAAQVPGGQQGSGGAQPPAPPAAGTTPTGERWERAAAAPRPPGNWDGAWDPTLPMVPSAMVNGDPVAVIDTLLGYSRTSAQVTQDMGRQFLQTIGLVPPGSADSGITNGRIPRVYGRQASEYVIRRGLSQRGVPYSWGGGNAAGPSRGIDGGANTVGFDCSGLILYAFAGVGIKLPHYSGAQYKMGRHIPSAQMRRGDAIFYGPGGSQHVALYLGRGQMLEAPDVGQRVKTSPVRTSGMTPFVVRYIEY